MNNSEVFDKNSKTNFNNALDTSYSNNLQNKINNINLKSNNSDFVANKTNKLNKNDNTVSRIRNVQNGGRKLKSNSLINNYARKGLGLLGASNAVSNNKIKTNAMSKIPGLSFLDKFMDRSETESQETVAGDGSQNFIIPKKVIKALVIAGPALLTIVIFCSLIMAAFQVYRSVIPFGLADNMSSKEATEDIKNFIDKHEDNISNYLDKELGYNGIMYEEESIYNAKFKESNLVEVGFFRPNNEANFDDLEDFFPTINKYEGNYVYDFFYKMYNLNQSYIKQCGSSILDLPLLMSTLRIQSTDMNVVFEANISHSDLLGLNNVDSTEYLYDYDWSGYVTTSTKSTHDMEVLAQNMISKQVTEQCVNTSGYITKSNILKDDEIGTVVLACDENEKYQLGPMMCVKDDDKYEEFLKEFLEKKYFINTAETKLNYVGINGDKYNSNDESHKDGNYVSNVTFTNSNFGEIVYFNQRDYESYYYSSNPQKPEITQGGKFATIKSHGCGPTSLAMVASSILNKTIDPIEMTSKVCSAGGCGSSGSFYNIMVNVAKNEYGLNVKETSDDQEVINALGKGNSLVLVIMGPGVFTTSGHFIVLTGVDANGQVSVADSYSRENTEKKWFSFNTIVEQRKTYAPYLIFTR